MQHLYSSVETIAASRRASRKSAYPFCSQWVERLHGRGADCTSERRRYDRVSGYKGVMHFLFRLRLNRYSLVRCAHIRAILRNAKRIDPTGLWRCSIQSALFRTYLVSPELWLFLFSFYITFHAWYIYEVVASTSLKKHRYFVFRFSFARCVFFSFFFWDPRRGREHLSRPILVAQCPFVIVSFRASFFFVNLTSKVKRRT